MIRRVVTGALSGAMLAACGDDSTGPGRLIPVASVAIGPIPDTVLLRQTLELEVATLDRQGSPLRDRPVMWESADPAVASVTAGGVLSAEGPGTTVIRAKAEAAADSVTVTVRSLLFQHLYPGNSVSCGLESSGDAWCWGKVGSVGYGNGSLDETTLRVPARAALGHTFVSLALAATSACGIELSGRVVCWGRNESGQLGDGTTPGRPVPTPRGGRTRRLDSRIP